MKFTWKNYLFFALIVFSLLLTGCNSDDTTAKEPASSQGNDGSQPSGEESKQPDEDATEEGGRLIFAIANDVDGLDPHRTVSASTFQVSHNIYETLVSVTPQGELVPQLAKEWEMSDDNKTWVFTLQEGVTFHNGKEFTAEDVVFTLDRLKEEDSPRVGEYANIINYEATGELEITMELESVDATFLSQLANPWSAIVHLEDDEKLYGTGPFELVTWEPQQYIELVKNEHYYEAGKPHLDEVRFEIIPNASTLMANLQSEVVHIGGVSGEQLPQLENLPHLKMQGASQNSVQLMAMNNEREPLNDVRVRQAISKAINKGDIIEGASWGFGDALGSHLPPLSPFYVDTNDVLPYDMDAAVALLTEAGYPDGFEITLSLPEGYDVHVNAGQIIADQLSRIGIDVKIEIVEWGIWLEDIYRGRKYDLTVISHTGRLDPHAFLNRYRMENAENYFNYVNEDVDTAIADAVVELDLEKRKELYAFVQQTLAEEVPAVYLQSTKGITAVHSTVHGYESFPIGIIHLKDVYFE
ncbi:ABC transporter substrate-binding protein [Evansella sp. AB-rgal1]|uniref:ABC transporter substrate-binding protein n=1 Tax=Evansella sp. AB-rgal1 TaxID=3242696 RepID=UPI00359E0517